jgi:hypothetical protein
MIDDWYLTEITCLITFLDTNKFKKIELLKDLIFLSSRRFQIIHSLYHVYQMSDAALNQFIICIVPLKDVPLPSPHFQQAQSRTQTEDLTNITTIP